MPKITADVFHQFYEPEWNICARCLHEFTAAPGTAKLDWLEVAGDVVWYLDREWNCPKCHFEISVSEIVDESKMP